MKGLNSEQAGWLNKYVRESWNLDEDGRISVKGNVHLHDSSMQKLPFKFSKVAGTFRCFNCTSLTSTEGFPLAENYIFENCALPSEWYLESLHNNISIEDYVRENFDQAFTLHSDIVLKYFPQLCQIKRGTVAGIEFGF